MNSANDLTRPPHILTLKKPSKRAREATITVVAALLADIEAAPALHSAALSMLRRICLQVPSRAEGRNLAMGAVTTLLFALPSELVHAFVGFVAKLARATKVAQRMGAVLLVERILAVALSGGAPTLWRAPTSGSAASCAPVLLAGDFFLYTVTSCANPADNLTAPPPS